MADSTPDNTPDYTQGEPVKVAHANNEPEAEFIQSMLREQGIPSFTRRSRGFDVPDFLAAGPRDIMVASSAAERSREILHENRYEWDEETSAQEPSSADWIKPLAFILLVVFGIGALTWLVIIVL